MTIESMMDIAAQRRRIRRTISALCISLGISLAVNLWFLAALLAWIKTGRPY